MWLMLSFLVDHSLVHFTATRPYLPPVILLAITTFFLPSPLSIPLTFIHSPITSSESPSFAIFPSLGMGYCSAVSIKLTPCFMMAVSRNSNTCSLFGALKSADTLFRRIFYTVLLHSSEKQEVNWMNRAPLTTSAIQAPATTIVSDHADG